MPWETPQAVESWLGQERAGLTALALSLVRSQADAEDCVQDAYLAALRDPPITNPGAWLRTVVRRGAHRRGRDAARRWRREARAARPEGGPSADHTAEHLEIRQRVLAAVQALVEPYRTTVVLRYFDGHPPAKIAALQGIPVKRVKDRLYRALALLRSSLDQAYGNRRSAWAPLVAEIGGVGHFGLLVLLKKVAAVGAILLVAGGVTWWAMSPRAEERVESASVEMSAPGGAPTLAGSGHAPAPAASSVLREGDPVPLATYAGRVVDPEGRGVQGARVEVLWQGAGPSTGETGKAPHLILRREAERRERPFTITNEEGYFRKDRPYHSVSYLRVDAKGFVPQIVGPRASGAFLLVRVATSGETRLRVLTEAGSPLAGAEVRLTAPRLEVCNAPYRQEAHRQLLASVHSGASGKAALPSFTGTMGLEVVPAEPDLEFVGRSLSASDEETEIRVRAVAKVVERRIVDSESGAPIPEAWVDVFPEGRDFAYDKGPQRRRIPTDPNGRVRIPGQPGHDRIYACAPGYEPSGLISPWGSDPDTDVALVRAMRVEGLVIDEDGAPVADAAIVVVSPDTGRGADAYQEAQWGRPPIAAWSDERGRYFLEVLPSARPFDFRAGDKRPLARGVRTILALHPAHAAGAADGVQVEPGRREDLTLRFPRPGSLAVEVVDKDGHPIAGQGVVVERMVPPAAPEPGVARSRGVDTVALLRRRTLATDGSGRVLADGLSPGRHLVLAQNTRVEAEVREGEITNVRVVKGAGTAVRGRVVDSKGMPRSDVVVTLYYDTVFYDGLQSTSRPGPDGRFVFDDVPESKGGYWVVVTRDDVTLGSFQLRTDEEATLRIPSGPARVRIRVIGPPEGTFRLTAAGNDEYTMVGRGARYALLCGPKPFAASGFNLSILTANPIETPPFLPGPGVLLVRAKGFGWAAVSFEAPEEVTTDVVVNLPPSGQVAVRPSAALLALKPGYMVRLRRSDGSPDPIAARWFPTDVYAFDANSEMEPPDPVDGVFRLTDVPPGPYEVSFGRYEEYRSWVSRSSARIEVRSGETTSIDL